MKTDLRSARAFFALLCSFLLHSCIVPERPAPPGTAPQEDIAEPGEAASPADDDDAGRPARPALGPPYRFNVDSIIRLVFARSARVTAAREEMIASQYGLQEFRRNLSRLEPFVETRADISDFPYRSGAFGHQAEAVVGVQKETFEGAILRTEVGGAMSRFEFGGPASAASPLEEGEGVLMCRFLGRIGEFQVETRLQHVNAVSES